VFFDKNKCVLYSERCQLHIRTMQKTMFLREVLTEMKKLDENKNPVPFSITVRTYNQQNKVGGRLVTWDNATLMQPPKTPGKIRLSQKIDFKNPNHFKNHTRNLKTNLGKKKINILFITMFNGYDVIL
jgi:hypothetical protein